MLYHAYEMTHAALSPVRLQAKLLRDVLSNRCLPFARSDMARGMVAACDVFESATRRYDRPDFGLDTTTVAGEAVGVRQRIVRTLPFCNLVHFERDRDALRAARGDRAEPKVLIVAPMSGHFPTLLRGTVEAMLPEHEVYVTDWRDARMVPLLDGRFDLDSYIDYVLAFARELGPDLHVMAVCQPAVAVLAAAARMEAEDDPKRPASIILMGGPVDPGANPTEVNRHAERHDLAWFETKCISTVPYPYPGCLRRVYPGFLQLSGFMAMNPDRHVTAYRDLFRHLVAGDGDPVRQHHAFYEEYLAVMDLPAEFFLQTLRTVFHEHALARGTMSHRGRHVDPGALRRTALMTIEGENDDICAVGQTTAAHDLCVNIPRARKVAHIQPSVGHYGVFNGRRWRTEIQPRVAEFVRAVGVA